MSTNQSIHLILSHGKESGPEASKIVRLASLAAAEGISSERPDYGTVAPAAERLEQLLTRIANARASRSDVQIILAGSSYGAYISALASLRTSIKGLFLLAPPIFFAGTEAPIAMARDLPVSILHGWQDELIDPIEVTTFARAYGAELTLIADSHRLSQSEAVMTHTFARWLQRVRASLAVATKPSSSENP